MHGMLWLFYLNFSHIIYVLHLYLAHTFTLVNWAIYLRQWGTHVRLRVGLRCFCVEWFWLLNYCISELVVHHRLFSFLVFLKVVRPQVWLRWGIFSREAAKSLLLRFAFGSKLVGFYPESLWLWNILIFFFRAELVVKQAFIDVRNHVWWLDKREWKTWPC